MAAKVATNRRKYVDVHFMEEENADEEWKRIIATNGVLSGFHGSKYSPQNKKSQVDLENINDRRNWRSTR